LISATLSFIMIRDCLHISCNCVHSLLNLHGLQLEVELQDIPHDPLPPIPCCSTCVHSLLNLHGLQLELELPDIPHDPLPQFPVVPLDVCRSIQVGNMVHSARETSNKEHAPLKWQQPPLHDVTQSHLKSLILTCVYTY
jgi:hypothetical protein